MADILQGGTAVVTGAASGIGRATAIAFAKEGCANIALGDIDTAGLEQTKKLIQEQNASVAVKLGHLDVSSEQAVTEFYESVVAEFGRIDFAANIAGYGGTAAPITEASVAEYQKHFNVNQKGIFLCERFQLRQMLKQEPLHGFESRGSIVNVTSLCATIAMPGMSAYSATKAGALGLAKVDALDYGPSMIRVNTVAPGNVITPMLERAMGEGHLTRYAAATPLRRLGRPEDIANAIVFLSGPRAQYITGISLPVDGGLNLGTGPP